MPQVESFFRALADRNRLRIVNLLSYHDLCVCDLQVVLGLAQPFISRHLAYLRRAGLVQDRREGARVCYSLALNDALSRAVHSLLLVAVKDSFAFQSDLATLMKLASSGSLKSTLREPSREQLEPRAA